MYLTTPKLPKCRFLFLLFNLLCRPASESYTSVPPPGQTSQGPQRHPSQSPAMLMNNLAKANTAYKFQMLWLWPSEPRISYLPYLLLFPKTVFSKACSSNTCLVRHLSERNKTTWEEMHANTAPAFS